jgi:hypothetical protein
VIVIFPSLWNTFNSQEPPTPLAACMPFFIPSRPVQFVTSSTVPWTPSGPAEEIRNVSAPIN